MSNSDSNEITPESSWAKPAGGVLGVLREMALVAVVAGAMVLVGLMLWVGHRNPSRVLLILFAIWVLSPFVALVVAHAISRRWSVLTRAVLHSVMLILTTGSLASFGFVAFSPPVPKPAAVFLIVPLVSWLALAIAIPMAGLISGKLAHGGGDAS
jgi:hypothetical protein